jgi:SAM-dependent methyltransferase
LSPSLENQLLLRLRRRPRWAAGKGWTEADFDARYLETTDDAWSYSNSDAHQNRFSLIPEAIPNRLFNVGLELGCAEGQFTRHLAARVERLLASDISARAIERARMRNACLENVEFAQ